MCCKNANGLMWPRGFVKLKKIREQLGSGWVGQTPTRIVIFFLNCVFCDFCVVFCCCTCFQKKLKMGRGGRLRSGQSEFFLDFFHFFNLTRPLNNNHNYWHIILTQHNPSWTQPRGLALEVDSITKALVLYADDRRLTRQPISLYLVRCTFSQR